MYLKIKLSEDFALSCIPSDIYEWLALHEILTSLDRWVSKAQGKHLNDLGLLYEAFQDLVETVKYPSGQQSQELALSPSSLIFSMHARKEGGLVSDVVDVTF